MDQPIGHTPHAALHRWQQDFSSEFSTRLLELLLCGSVLHLSAAPHCRHGSSCSCNSHTSQGVLKAMGSLLSTWWLSNAVRIMQLRSSDCLSCCIQLCKLHDSTNAHLMQAYLAARESGKDEAGDVLLVLMDRLSKANYKDTFVDEFGVSTCWHSSVMLESFGWVLRLWCTAMVVKAQLPDSMAAALPDMRLHLFCRQVHKKHQKAWLCPWLALGRCFSRL